MEHFKQIINNIISYIIISSDDSETEKAKKIMRYAFVGSLFVVFLFAWLIFVILTFSENIVKVPNVEGDYIYSALKKISDKNLIANVSPKYSDRYKEGVVYDQSPWQGSIVKKGRVVSFNVSLGTLDNALPDVTGFNLLELSVFLDKKYHGGSIPFKIDSPKYEFNENIEKGKIFKMEPGEGTFLKEVNKLKIWISNGPEDKNALLLKNYVDKNFNVINEELANAGVPYSFEFVFVKNKKADMTIAEQSIGENALIKDIIAEKKNLILKVNKFNRLDNKDIEGTHLINFPKKTLPYKVDITLTNKNETDIVPVVSFFTRGGISSSIPFINKEEYKLVIYFDGAKSSEVILKEAVTDKL
ncbi:MAG: PASTA domain-containing protein [Spirochaetes bacterium]|nr:PASTA domain-containing protein [Spirochaetota bacterium]